MTTYYISRSDSTGRYQLVSREDGATEEKLLCVGTLEQCRQIYDANYDRPHGVRLIVKKDY